MTDFDTVTPKGPTYWGWQFDGTQESVDAFNTRSGNQPDQTIEFVSPTEAKFAMVQLPVDLNTTFVVQVDPAGNSSISYYSSMADAQQYFDIS